MAASAFYLLIVVGGALMMPTQTDSCLPPVDIDAILVSVDSSLERQMDRFPPPGDYPEGYEEAQLIQTYDFVTSGLQCVPPYWRADVYDTALAAIYFIRRGNLERARKLVDGIRLVQAYDPIGDGRTRTSYDARDLLDDSGQASPDDPTTGTGNMAWQGIALVQFFCATAEHEYLDAAKLTADWINDHTEQPQTPDDPFGGFSLGEDADGNPLAGTTKGRSIEHNVDVYVLATNLYNLEHHPKWLAKALHAQAFVEQMFDDAGGKYWLGTKEDAGTGEIVINYWPQSTDGQAWTALAGIDTDERATRALQWLVDPPNGMLVKDVVCEDKTCADPCLLPCDLCFCEGSTSDCCYWGMRFTNCGDHIQSEVTAGAAMALCLDGQHLGAMGLLCNLERIRLTAPNHDTEGKGVVATPWCDCATTCFASAEYPNERHVASTVWTALAFMVARGAERANPLRPIPAGGCVVPALSEWGMVATTLLVLTAGILIVMRRRSAQS